MPRLVNFVLFATLLVTPWASVAGQGVPHYSPQRPTLSPYLNLLRNDTSPLPNYYSLVRPQLNEQAFQNRLTRTTRAQGLAVQSLTQLAESGTAAPTGSGSVFQNRSHFYQARRPGFGRR